MRILSCKVCSDYMYFADSPKIGIDFVLTPRNDGLKAEVICQSCGSTETALFNFLRFESEPLTQTEIAAIFDASRPVQRRFKTSKQS